MVPWNVVLALLKFFSGNVYTNTGPDLLKCGTIR